MEFVHKHVTLIHSALGQMNVADRTNAPVMAVQDVIVQMTSHIVGMVDVLTGVQKERSARIIWNVVKIKITQH